MASSSRRLVHVSNHLASGSPATIRTAGVIKWLTNLFSADSDDVDDLATELPLASDAVAVVSHDDYRSQNVDGGHVCVSDCLPPAHTPLLLMPHTRLEPELAIGGH